MRTIKFRQPIRDENGIFQEWFYWGLLDNTFITPANQMNRLKTREESQQFTGLCDMKKIEIYEGDILLKDLSKRQISGHPQKWAIVPISPLVVSFHEGRFVLRKRKKRTVNYSLSGLTIHQNGLTIMGNIYETII
jgi:hypothetical protein